MNQKASRCRIPISEDPCMSLPYLEKLDIRFSRSVGVSPEDARMEMSAFLWLLKQQSLKTLLHHISSDQKALRCSFATDNFTLLYVRTDRTLQLCLRNKSVEEIKAIHSDYAELLLSNATALVDSPIEAHLEQNQQDFDICLKTHLFTQNRGQVLEACIKKVCKDMVRIIKEVGRLIPRYSAAKNIFTQALNLRMKVHPIESPDNKVEESKPPPPPQEP